MINNYTGWSYHSRHELLHQMSFKIVHSVSIRSDKAVVVLTYIYAYVLAAGKINVIIYIIQ